MSGNGAPGLRDRVRAAVVAVERGAVVDAPQLRRATRAGSGSAAVRSTFSTSASNQTIVGGQLRRRARTGRPGCRSASRAGSPSRGSCPGWPSAGPGSPGRARPAPAPGRAHRARAPGPAGRRRGRALRRRARPRAPSGPGRRRGTSGRRGRRRRPRRAPGIEPPSRSGGDVARRGDGAQGHRAPAYGPRALRPVRMRPSPASASSRSAPSSCSAPRST